jgi:hypothetical protein
MLFYFLLWVPSCKSIRHKKTNRFMKTLVSFDYEWFKGDDISITNRKADPVQMSAWGKFTYTRNLVCGFDTAFARHLWRPFCGRHMINSKQVLKLQSNLNIKNTEGILKKCPLWVVSLYMQVQIICKCINCMENMKLPFMSSLPLYTSSNYMQMH